MQVMGRDFYPDMYAIAPLENIVEYEYEMLQSLRMKELSNGDCSVDKKNRCRQLVEEASKMEGMWRARFVSISGLI